MGRALRNRIIGWAFALKGWAVRARRRLSSVGGARLGALDHVTIPVKDLGIAENFYCGVLGAGYLMKVDDETFRRFGRPPAENHGDGAYHISVYVSGSTRIDLFLQSAGQPAPTAGHPHFAFKVSPKGIRKWRGVLEAKAIPFDGPLQLGPPGQASLYFNDPFGNHLEITCFGFDEDIPIRAPVMAKLAWSSEVLG